MRPLVTAFLLGLVAVGVAAGAAAVAAAIAADAGGWGGYRISLGPLLLTEFERDGADTAASFGPGLAVVATVGGVLNALGAALLLRRRA